MRRRDLLKSAAIIAGGVATCHAELAAALLSPIPIDKVLVITKCHLDVGFTMTQEKVLRQYFDHHFPEAMRTAAALRASGKDRYVWTTGSWLLYEYLEQASPQQRRQIEEAIIAGDLTWHALPFTWQTEMLDRSMIEGGLGFSSALDARFGHRTTGAKMTDVPGHTRGIIAPLRAGGVGLLDIGVNAASTPPDVPDVFLWKDSHGNSIPVIYHRHDYGSVVAVPGTSVAIAVVVRGDNSGPHTPAEISDLYAKLRAQFPGASVVASNLNEAATVVERVRESLPQVTTEIGDTWIYGVASDPVKVSRYRNVTRLRQTWIAQRKLVPGDATDLQMLRRLLLAVEHTWGTDTKSYLDDSHYRPEDLSPVLDQPGYRIMEHSWQEKRDDLEQGIATLPEKLRQEATAHLTEDPIKMPSTAGLKSHPPGESFQTPHFLIGLSAETGAITRLQERTTGREWASEQHPLALFTYQTLSAAQYAAFLDKYVKSKESWAPRDFGKPGIDRFEAMAQEWHPRLVECWTDTNASEARLLLHLRIEDAAAIARGAVAWPKEIFLDLRMPAKSAQINLELTVLDKQPNRMPEAMWLTFNPAKADISGWTLDKAGEHVALNDVVQGGGRAMHGITGDARYVDSKGSLTLQTLDAAILAVGVRSPLNFTLLPPSVAQGLHFGLFNNAWGTNYLQWCGGSWRYRFTLSSERRT